MTMLGVHPLSAKHALKKLGRDRLIQQRKKCGTVTWNVPDFS